MALRSRRRHRENQGMRTTFLASKSPAEEPTVVVTRSVIPAIDDLVRRYTGRSTVAAGEVVDMLLDLRLLAHADELVGSRS